MKRLICVLLILSMLMGCGRQVISPVQEAYASPVASAENVLTTATPSETPTPDPTATPRPSLATYPPQSDSKALFPEEILSVDGEPIGSMVRSLLEADGISKVAFYDRFLEIVHRADELDSEILRLSDQGRTLTADRKERTSYALMELISTETQAALTNAYSNCTGDGEDLPMAQYSASIDSVLQDMQRMEERTVSFYDLGASGAREYRTVLDRFMGETVVPLDVFRALEELLETEAIAINAALKADPEAARKRELISFGSFEEDMRFLIKVTEDLCPLSDGSSLPMPMESYGREDMSLMELAFHCYPGMAYLKTYAAQGDEAQQARWANAPNGYLAGLAIHCSFAVTQYLDGFGLDYVQYRWYEEMLDVTLTGICALLIHYYGYSEQSLAEYLKSWNAEKFVDYLYGKAMSDPFESLVAVYGYWQYLDICQAALDAGCETEQRFLQDYLGSGPAPYEALKEYMVSLYQNQG